MGVPCRPLIRRYAVLPAVDGEPHLASHFALDGGEVVFDPQPGDVWERSFHEPGAPWCWANCSGANTFVILPNRRSFDCDMRASNCTMLDDRHHRCWVKHGSAAGRDLHLDKDGLTCQAGAGSILSYGVEAMYDRPALPGWHGYLHHFQLVG